jgi:ATP-binding cassette, subfamily B, bacterial HlyB/CyaB
MDVASASGDTGLSCLVFMARFLRLPVEPDQLRFEAGKTDQHFTAQDVVRAAKRLDLKARRTKVSPHRMDMLPLPAIVEMRDRRFVILAAVTPEKVLIRDFARDGATELPRAEFERDWSRQAILLTTRKGVSQLVRRFDFSWFIPEMVRYRRMLGEILLATFFVQVVALISPIFFQLVIDKVLVHQGLSTLHVLIIGLAAISLFETFLSALRAYVLAHTAAKVDVTLGSKLFHHLLALPISYFEARQTGQSVARIRELENIRSFLMGSALTSLLDVIFAIVLFAVMWFYSPALTGIVMASVPCYLVLSVAVTPALRRRIDEKFARGAENQTFLVESIVGVETIKAMAVEPQMQRRWEDQLAGYVWASFRSVSLGNAANHIAQLISKAVSVATLWWGAQLVIDGDMSIGQLVAFNMLAQRVAAPVLRLAQLWQEFQQVRVSVDRLGDILNTPTEMLGGSSGMLRSVGGRVLFDHVTFRYSANAPEVLSDVTLAVEPGEVIGIVGSSGSGKSTFAKLVQRLYVPVRGRVLVDGVDLAMADPRWLRRQIGVVLQENVLFHSSVRENIALADPSLPFERVVEAAKLSGAHDFILKLAQGYDTVLEERGANLSGGQRQRIAIARALITNPRILIFDEATSALDYESEYVVQQNMSRITRGRTVFIIAHRLAAIRAATRIIAVEAGRIVEQGTHDELLRSNGRYATLWRLQSQAATTAAE